MSIILHKIKGTVTTGLIVVMFSLPASVSNSQDLPKSEALLQELQQANPTQADRLARRLLDEWSKSGSPAMDLLLKRGRDALAIDKSVIASQHFRALTDHAPDFAEGWHGLALAYFQMQQFGPCMDALEHTLALNPKHFGAMRGVGAVYEQLDRPKLAFRAYKHVLSVHPHDEDVLEALARLEVRANGVEL